MSPKYIIFPVGIYIKTSIYRHTGHTIERFGDGKRIDIQGSVKAVLCENKVDGLAELKEAVKKEYAQFVIHNHYTKDLELGDFELVYSVSEIQDSRAWGGCFGISRTKLG